jgi:hypothetical protein
MKKLFIGLLFSISLIAFVSCSESTDTGKNAYVMVKSQFTTGSVAKLLKTQLQDEIQFATIDSIKVAKIRILISQLKLTSGTNDQILDNNNVKLGPYLIYLDSTGLEFTLADGQVPAGTYEKIKYEFHRFPTSELANYANSTLYKDFATADRYNAIINGLIYSGSSVTPFTYNGTITANLSLNFTAPIVMGSNTSTEIILTLNPEDLLKKNNIILDPTDNKNQNDIDNNLRDMIKAYKK